MVPPPQVLVIIVRYLLMRVGILYHGLGRRDLAGELDLDVGLVL